jgi:hypothetical protein
VIHAVSLDRECPQPPAPGRAIRAVDGGPMSHCRRQASWMRHLDGPGWSLSARDQPVVFEVGEEF